MRGEKCDVCNRPEKHHETSAEGGAVVERHLCSIHGRNMSLAALKDVRSAKSKPSDACLFHHWYDRFSEACCVETSSGQWFNNPIFSPQAQSRRQTVFIEHSESRAARHFLVSYATIVRC